jgi:hypothetical protein
VEYLTATDGCVDVTDIVKLAVLIWRFNADFQLTVVIELVLMQEETGADGTFPGFVAYFTKYELPRKTWRG